MYSRNYILILVAISIVACYEEGSNTTSKPGPYKLTFSLDGSFHVPHGNEPIRIALVRLSDSVVVAQEAGIVSITENPAFSFTTTELMDRGLSYAVHYWIDSNIGGGTLGLCDSTDLDHQWSTEFFTVTNDINFTVGYEPSLVEYVCSTFS